MNEESTYLEELEELGDAYDLGMHDGMHASGSLEDELNNSPYSNKTLRRQWESGFRVAYRIKGKL